MNEPKTVRIAGKRVRVRIGGLPRREWGRIEHPDTAHRTIHLQPALLKPRLSRMLLNVLIHEILHGEFWSLDEEFITQAADDIERALTAFGYERQFHIE